MLEHVHRYALARDMAVGQRVLDIACGEGYGSWLMSQVAETVTGVDVAEEVVTYARHRYSQKNLKFLQGSCAEIPLESASVDLVISFETIEHHDKHEQMLMEVKRVLRPEGILVISTPDRRVYTDELEHQNPFHVKEYYAEEFIEVIRRHFSNAAFYGQRMFFGSCVGPILSEPPNSPFVMYHGGFDGLQISRALPNAVYLIAIAGNTQSLPTVPISIYSLSDKVKHPPTLLQHAWSAVENVWHRAWRRIRGSRHTQV